MTSAARTSALATHPRARWLLPTLLVVLVAFSVQRLRRAPGEAHAGAPGVPGAPGDGSALQGETMGTTWSVRLPRGLEGTERDALAAAVQDCLDAVDARMSTWRSDSELSRFNAAPAGTAFAASPELLEVLGIAHEVSEATDGAFDVTVAPLVAAWGFGATDRIPAPPPSAELAALRDRTGYERLAIGKDTLEKLADGVTVDLSAVAKGWAVDRVGELLAARGHDSYLVEVGGELAARGTRADGEPWRVGLERPVPGASRIHRLLHLSDLALATSGDYRNYYEADGRWLSHLIDPRTAMPIQHGLASVSVAHPSAARADALATALIVLGPRAGRELAERAGWTAHFVVRMEGNRLESFSTAGFEELFVRDATPAGDSGGAGDAGALDGKAGP